MFVKLNALNQQHHAHAKVSAVKNFAYAANLQLAALVAQEFPRASALYPVIFLKDAATSSFRPYALLGIDEGKNSFVDKDGKWKASYVPAVVRQYPFALVSAPNEGEAGFVVCVDEGSSCFNQQQGEPLFNQDGQPTPVLQGALKYLTDLQHMDAQTQEFCRFLAEHNLLVPLQIHLTAGSNAKHIQGSYVIDESRLAALPNDVFIAARERGYLPSIYAHLTSLAQVEHLLTLAAEVQSPQPSTPSADLAITVPSLKDVGKPQRKGRRSRHQKS